MTFEIEPYEELGVDKKATPIDIKKAYRKLCLKYHPDKVGEETKEKFQQVVFAYSIIGDVNKRKKYDETGSFDSGEGFDWKEFFSGLNAVTEDMIEEDRIKYVGSEEEKRDILDTVNYYEGDFLKVFECVPHLEYSEANESRVFDMVSDAKLDYKKWHLYVKNREKKRTQYERKLKKEEKEAEELKKELNIGKLGDEDELRALIQKKNGNQFDSMISHLEKKYGGKKETGRLEGVSKPKRKRGSRGSKK